jgi:hypothetical protein
MYRYGVYGIELASSIPLPLPDCIGAPLARFALSLAAPDVFAEGAAAARLVSPDSWCELSHLADGGVYVRWEGLGEFVVSADGARICCAKTPGAHDESFQVYLLGQALSYALVKAGFEPIHGTVLVHEGRAIALLGDSGYGKSTLAACMLSAGARLLTDDLLVAQPLDNGYLVHPGPTRIKLMPDSAARFLPGAAEGVPMNPLTTKKIIRLGDDVVENGPAPLAGVYVLPPPLQDARRRRIHLRPMSAREAFVALVANTFNTQLKDPGRLGRQHNQTAALARAVPTVELAYPRGIQHVEALAQAILTHAGSAARAA